MDFVVSIALNFLCICVNAFFNTGTASTSTSTPSEGMNWTIYKS